MSKYACVSVCLSIFGRTAWQGQPYVYINTYIDTHTQSLAFKTVVWSLQIYNVYLVYTKFSFQESNLIYIHDNNNKNNIGKVHKERERDIHPKRNR